MKDIAIYGFGGLGREVACIINAINKISPVWNLTGFFDDGYGTGTSNQYGRILGGLKELNAYDKELAVVIAIASSDVLESISKSVNNKNITFPNIIAPDVLFFDEQSVQIGCGNILGFGVRLSCNVQLGDFNLLNGCVSLGHDVVIGNYNILQPEVRISGETSILNSNFFGVRSVVLQGMKIGSKTRIGAGSLVMRKTKDGMTYFGNPAKQITT